MEKKTKVSESAKTTWKGRYGAARKAVAKKADVNKKVSSSSSTDEDETDGEPRTSKRVRSQYQPFQSPEALAVLAPALYKPQPKACSNSKNLDDKIVIFSKGDFLAVRNDEGTFYVCRTAQNVYKSSRKFKIQWLNDEKEAGMYIPDFYDHTNFECVLTNLAMDRKDKNKFHLPEEERKRTMNILERAINVEKGLTEVPDPRKVVSDGVDVSIVGKEEEQELIKISPKPTIKVAKEKPAKIPAARSKRSSPNGEVEPSPKERRRSSDTNDNIKATPSTSTVKRERRSFNVTTTETPTTEDRRHTRSSSRSFKGDVKSPPASKPSTSTSSSTPTSSLSKTTSSRKRSLRNHDSPPSNSVEVKCAVRRSRSHSDRSNHSDDMEQSDSMRLVNMHTHETRRPKIRITCNEHLVDVRIKVPLDNIKTETAINFVHKYCTPKIVSVIQKRMEYLGKGGSPTPPRNMSPPSSPKSTPVTLFLQPDTDEPDSKRFKEEKDLYLTENGNKETAMESDGPKTEESESENEARQIAKELKSIASNHIKEEQLRAEKEKADKEKAEKERLEKERLEKERVEKEKKDKLEKEKAEKERLAKEKAEKAEKEKLEKLEKDRAEKLEREKIAKEKIEKEKAEKAEKERLEKEKLEKERLEKEKKEKERVEKEKQDKLEKEKAEKERLEKEKLEREKIEKEKLEKEKIEKERLEKEKAEKEKAEKEKLEKEKQEKERIEKEKLEKEKAEKERLEKEKAEKERLEKEKVLKEKAEKEKIEKEKAEKDKAEKEKIEKEKIEKEKSEKEKAEKERLEKEKVEKEKQEKEREREREREEKEKTKDKKEE